MFKVTVNGETREWMTFEYALTDALSRGVSANGWKIEKLG
jgi:hypothetical protein